MTTDADPPTRLQPWPVLQQRLDRSYPIFDVRLHESTHPRTGASKTYVVLDSPEWVQIVALTPDDRAVLVRQFRHGTGRITLEAPGGLVDPGETPLAAAVRELREETGFAATTWVLLGRLAANPAFMANHCHVFLALDARPVGAPEPDAGEDIEVVALPLPEVGRLVREGGIDHSIVVAAFGMLRDRAGGWRRPRVDPAAADPFVETPERFLDSSEV